MQLRNYILFIALSIAVMVGYQTFVLPRVRPQPAPAGKDAADEANAAAKSPDTKKEALSHGDRNPVFAPRPAPKAKELAAQRLPHRSIILGSGDPDTGYFLKVDLTSQGAAVASIELNDPRYRDLNNPKEPLRLIGGNRTTLRTFSMRVPDLDAALAGNPAAPGPSVLAETEWEVADVAADPKHVGVNTAAVFRFHAPDGRLVLEKRYTLVPINKPNESSVDARDTAPAGYTLHLDLTMRNAGGEPINTSYALIGPVGLPLENADNTRKFRDLKMGFLTAPGVVSAQSKTATQVFADEEKQKDLEWKTPLAYIGVDIQYFAALIVPVQNQLEQRTIERSMPLLLDNPPSHERADLTVRLDSVPIALAPNESVTHGFELFAGPKRRDLLEPLQADAVLDFGWFAKVSHAMLALLKFFHQMGVPYGIAIVCLTVLVRACLFPLTLRQTAQAQRMKEMQPKLAEIKKKYANDREKLATANLELMRQYKVNPLGGCLPLLLQFPIFIGLYQALNNAVDLRGAPFLYFDNLAAPDALFHLPFSLPFLGSDFNLLPLVTVALFVVQQKMFMPPPVDEQQAMQYKMMNVMMVVMGVFFYRVPAGLCIYFISSSLWGLGERKLIEWWKSKKSVEGGAAPEADGTATRSPESPPDRPREPSAARSLWRRLLNAADSAGSDATSGSKSSGARRDTPRRKKSGKRSR